MKRIIPGMLLLSMTIACTNKDKKMEIYKWPDVKAPVAEIKPITRILHGDTVTDNYYWMIDYFKKGPDSTKVVDYLKAENTYLDQMMKGTDALQSDLFKEMKGRIKEKDESVPVFKNGYYYYSKTEEGKQYFKYCRKKGSLTAAEEVLLDIDDLAKDHSYYSATGFSISPDNKLLAYGVDNVSRRQYTIQVKDLETGAMLTDHIQNTEGDPVWAADNKTLFYTAKHPVTLLSEKIQKHRLGTDATKDPVVYEEKDKSNYIGVDKSKSGKYIFIYSSATLSSEARMIPADQPDAAFTVFTPRTKDVLYSVTPLADKFLILTNWNAKNFRLMECPLDQTGKEHWKEVIAHRNDVLVEGVDEFKDFIVISERKNGLAQLRIRNVNGSEHYIEFEEPAYTASVGNNPEYNSKTLRYIYTSMTTPVSTFDYNMETKAKKLMKQQVVVGGYNAEDYTTERLYATAKDGTKVPISIVYKKGLVKDGNAPLLLYAYGSYGHSIDAAFSINNLSLLNRGFVYAIAHIRGGQEMGRAWYEDGKLMKK